MHLLRPVHVRQTTIPTVTAADQVSVVFDPDEGSAAYPDGLGYGKRAKWLRP